MLLDLRSAFIIKKGGDDAFHAGWNKAAWKRKQAVDDALEQTIVETYRKVIGLDPTPEVVKQVTQKVEESRAIPQELPDFSHVLAWINTQLAYINQIILDQAEEDDEEAILLLLS